MLVLHFILIFVAVGKINKKFPQSYLTSFAMDIFQWNPREQSKKFEISFLRIKLLWDKQSFLFLNVDDCEGWFWWKWQLISSHPCNIMSSQPRIHKQEGYFSFNYLKGKEYSRVFMNLMWKRHSHFPLYLPSVFIYIYIYIIFVLTKMVKLTL